MAGSQITTSVTIINSFLGYSGVSLTETETSIEPKIAEGSKIEIAGAMFSFNSEEEITGWVDIPYRKTAYIYLTPSGIPGEQVVNAAWSASPPVWSQSKQGWYTALDSNIRCAGGCFKGGAKLAFDKFTRGSQEGFFRRRPTAISMALSVTGGFGLSSIGGVAALNDTDIALVTSEPSHNLQMCRFSGSAWSLVGSALSITTGNQPRIAALNDTDVALYDTTSDTLRTYRHSGSAWSLVGSALTTGSLLYSNTNMAPMSDTDIVFRNASNTRIQVYRFSGSAWSAVGSYIEHAAGAGGPGIISFNPTDIVVFPDSSDNIKAYRFSGSAWSVISTYGKSPGPTYAGSFGAIPWTEKDFIIAASPEAVSVLQIYRWTGAAISPVGKAIAPVPGHTLGNIFLTRFGGNKLAMFDPSNDLIYTVEIYHEEVGIV